MMIVRLLLGILFLLYSSVLHAQWVLNLESGAAFSGYNDVRIPGDEGTLIDVSDLEGGGITSFYRIRLSYTLNEKHTFSALFAPLDIRYDGLPGQLVRFQGAVFAADQPLQVDYQFNSYRLTYRFNFARIRRFRWGIGATAKIRDAVVQFSDANQQAEKTNLGFVPLVNFMAEWFVKERLTILLRGDALAAPQGRAEDVLLAAQLYPNEAITLRLGYRILEGGANSDEVYNFTLVHYAVIGATVTF